MKIRVGYGYDVHQLAEGETFVLGGIEINYHKGCIAHSDGDVLIHAICDALLGAANLRDIGFHFPDTAKEYEKIDSKILLKQTVALLAEKGYYISNIDSTIALQKPKLKDLIPQMKKTLAAVMGIDEDAIAIKATTTEKLGHVGREEGIDAYAVVLIQKD
jgi:2-C-methyl-D-erythritol 2,4-cyclodiphosphate synthase